MKEKIKEYALNKGLDICFVKTIAFDKPSVPLTGEAKNTVSGTKEILEGAKTIIVLFAPYSPCDRYREGMIHLSDYYRVSNASYHAAREVAELIQSFGAKAVLSTKLLAKTAAVLTGGAIGKNGFYYHERYGSLVCIHTIVTDLDLGEEYKEGESRCKDCTICHQSCPAGAIKKDGGVELSKCIRYYMNDTVPLELRQHIYQLLGCEKCQICCPLNRPDKSVEPAAFSIKNLLAGEYLNELQLLAGKNMARQKRVISQALLFAGAKRIKELKPYIEKHAQSETKSIREHSEWALKRLNDEL